MKLTSEELEILTILEVNSNQSAELIAKQMQLPVEKVNETIQKLEKEKVIVSYPALIDWSKVEDQENVIAMIEVNVTPKRGVGFDEVAEKIYRFPEVRDCYLMSGGFDLTVSVEGKTLKEVAKFVSEKLSTIENVVSTRTHFILKKYKHDGVIIEGKENKDRRMVVSP